MKMVRTGLDQLVNEKNLSEEEIESWVPASAIKVDAGVGPITLTPTDIMKTRKKNI